MANRVISSDLWNDKKWKGITNIRTRYVWLYLLTCPQSNSCGVFKLPLSYAIVDTGLSEDELKRSIRELQDLKLCIYDIGNEEIAILNYPIYNLRNITPQIANIVRIGLKSVKNVNLAKAVYLTLKKVNTHKYDLLIQEYENLVFGKGQGTEQPIGKGKPYGKDKVKGKGQGLGLGHSNECIENIKVSNNELELADDSWDSIMKDLTTI